MVLRGSGFPIRGLQALGAPEAAASATKLLEHIAGEAQVRERVIAALHARTETAVAGQGKLLGRLIRRLRNGDLPELDGAPDDAIALVGEVAAARAACDEARKMFEAVFAVARERVSARLREVAGDDRFREALLWQSPGALHGSVDGLLRQPVSAKDDKTRQQEMLVASYWQRYCAKNDTIGFFGPIGWAEVARQAALVECVPGAELVRRRTVFFEYWPIDMFATSLVENPELKQLLSPRWLPTVWLDGDVVHFPVDKMATLPPSFARALALCDGRTPATEIVARLLAQPELGLADEDEGYALLSELEEKKLISWSLEIPTHLFRPEEELETLLRRLPEGTAREQALGTLSRLCTARDRVVASVGDWRRLDESLEACEATFNELTGAPTARRAAARTIVSEDCLRDLHLRLSDELLTGLSPLSLVLTSARWMTWELARRHRAALREIYETLARETGAPVVDLLRFWLRAAQLLPENPRYPCPLIDGVKDEVTRRWASVLELDLAASRQERRAAELAPRVAAAFDAPSPGWPGARFHSPDWLIAADGLEAIQRNEHLFVLGEIHCAENTVCMPLFVEHHAAPEELHRLLRKDVGPRIEVVKLRNSVDRRGFSAPWNDIIHVETSSARSELPPENVLRIGDLVVEERDGLWVRTRDGARRFALYEFFGFGLTQTIGDLRLLPPEPHTPRVTIDRLVIARERWCFQLDELAFAKETSPAERFFRVRALARQRNLPRFVFAKIPEEEKPCYVDLESPIYVEILARLVRKASRLALSEMLPGPDQAWLPDREGNRYTSEFRSAAVDPLAGPSE
jgi:hypothetical protein